MAFKTLEEAILKGGAFPIENASAAIDAITADTLSVEVAARIPRYPVANLPAAAEGNVGQIAYVGNGAAGKPCLAVSTNMGSGTFAWKVVVDLDEADTVADAE